MPSVEKVESVVVEDEERGGEVELRRAS